MTHVIMTNINKTVSFCVVARGMFDEKRLSIFRCLLALTLTPSTDVSADGIEIWEPCVELRQVLPEASDGYEGSEKEVLEMMTIYDLCGFDEDDDSKI